MESECIATTDVKEDAAGDCRSRTKFGTRYLTDPQSVFQHNAWDNAVWDEEQEAAAQKIAQNHAEHSASLDKRDEYERDAGKNWDKFYNIHANNFFKDRHWLFTEFPELYGQEQDSETNQESATCTTNNAILNVEASKNNGHRMTLDKQEELISELGDNFSENSSLTLIKSEQTTKFHSFDLEQQVASMQVSPKITPSLRFLEVGCGVGNTVFPVLKTNKNPNLMIYCCDFSCNAVDIVKNHPDYDQKRCHAFVHDITSDNSDVPFPLESLDIIIMIFVLSAVSPEKMQGTVDRLASYLKPGGIFLFRDYGRYDMAQLRFKEGRCLSENFYVRGDGTRVYFFTQDELRTMFEQAGLQEKENAVDRRLQVNRGRQLKMYRVWIQCKFIKPLL